MFVRFGVVFVLVDCWVVFVVWCWFFGDVVGFCG